MKTMTEREKELIGVIQQAIAWLGAEEISREEIRELLKMNARRALANIEKVIAGYDADGD